MSVERIYKHEGFKRQLARIIKEYPKAEDQINKDIRKIEASPQSGDLIPGFRHMTRKTRIGIKKYNIGKSSGLRLIWLYLSKENILLYLCVYMHKDFKDEKSVRNLINNSINEAIKEAKPLAGPCL